MKKALLMLLMLLTMGISGFAQNLVTVIVGDTTTTSETYSLPFDNFYKNTWTQTIYSASDIAMAGVITSIAYQVSSVPTSTDAFSTVHIYMGTTSATENTSTSSWLPMADLTEVYSTTNMPLPTTPGWQVIQLDQPFLYDGSENLVIVISKTMAAYNSGLKYKYTSVTNSSLYRQSDSDVSYANHPGSNTGTRSAYRPNLMLTINASADFCHPISNLTLSGLTATDAILTWNSAPGASNYILQYKTAAQSWDNATVVDVYDTTYDLTGMLTAMTDYTVRIATDCGTDTSAWKNLTFTTPCSAISTLPFTDNFDAYTGATTTTLANSNLPYCWSHINNGTSTSYSGYPIIYASATYAASGINALRFYTYTTSGTYDDQMVILPQIDPSLYPANNLQLSFDARNNSTYTFTVVVGIIANPADKTTFVPTDTIVTTSNTYQNYEFPFSQYTGPEGFIAIMAPKPATSYNTGYIDNIVVDLIPSCPKPKNVTSTNPTLTSIDLSWTEMGSATAWDIEYGPTGFTPGTGTMESVTTNPYTINSLENSTVYDFYVRANCGGGDVSNFSVVYTTGTECAPISTLPFNMDLDAFQGSTSTTAATNNLPYCWSAINNGTSTSYSGYPIIYTSATYAASGSNTIRFYTYSTSGTYDDQMVVLPEIDPTLYPANNLQLAFDARNNGTYTLTLVAGIMTDPTDKTTFVAIDTISTSSNTYTNYEIPFSQYTGTGSYIAIMAPKPTTSTYNTGYIDNIVVDVIPTCPRPKNVATSNPTLTSIDLSWLEMGSATSWEIEYGPLGFAQGSGTVVVATSNPFTVSGLQHSTGYDFYVRATCGGNDNSHWTNKVTDATTCSPISNLPYTENFDGYAGYTTTTAATNNLPYCWSFLNAGTSTSYTGYPMIYSSATYAASGNNSIRFYTYTTSGTYDDQMAILPQFDVTTNPMNTLQINFDARNNSTYTFTLVVGVISDPTDKTTFVPVDTIITTSNTYNNYVVPFNQYTGTGSYIAMMALQPTSSYNSGFVDNVMVEVIPSCPRPTFLTATSTITDEVTLSWTDNNASQWDILYGPTGFNPTDPNAGTLVTGVTTNPYTLSGLTQGVYDFYVRANCGGGDLSDWTVNHATASSYTYTMGITGTDTVTGCDFFVVDNGGINGDYSNNCQYSLVIFPGEVDSVVSVSGTFDGESTIDYLSIYDGTVVDENNLIEKVVSGTSGNVVTFGPFHSSNGPLTLLFHSDGSVVRSGFVANVTCVEAPACPKPINIHSTYVSSTEANLTWEDNGASSYNVVYSIYPNFNPDTCTNVLTTTTNSILLDYLTPYTYYYVAIQGDCGGSLSEWSNLIYFRTSCEPSSTLPLIENFDNVPGSTSTSASTSNLPYCWTIINNGTSTSYSGYPMVYASATYAASGNNSMRFYTYTTSGTYDDQIAVLPPIDPDQYPVNSLQLNFDARANSTSYTFVLVVGVLSSPSDKTTFVPVDTFELTSTAYQSFELPLNQYQGMGNYIAFMAPQPTTGYNYGYVDNVVVDLIPACPKPINLAATSITESSIELTWTEVGDATSWEVVYGPAGFTPGDTNSNVEAATAIPYTLSNLTPATTYDIYVRSDCGSDYSQYGTKITVTTACVPVATLPYVEGFDTYGTGTTVYPTCWSKINTYTSGDRPYVNSTHYEGVGSLYFYASSTTYNVAITPMFDAIIPINTLQATFMYKATNSTDRLIVGVISNPTDISTFVPVDTVLPTSPVSTWIEREVNFNSYTGDGQYIAFYNGNPSAYAYAYIDNLVIDVIPTCPKPTQVHVTAITDNSATISWTAVGSETSWEIAYGPTGFDPDDAAATIVTANANPYTVQNLTPATPYEFYVRALCSATDQSPWSTQAASGVTQCSGAVALPYTENFDSYVGTTYSDANGIAPACWTTFSTNTSYGAPHITGSGSYHFTHSDPNCMVFTCGSAGSDAYAALPTFNQPLNTLTLNFWRAMESATNGSTLTVGYVTDLNDLATSFVLVDTIPSVTSTAGDTISVDFTAANIPANGNICFHWNYSTSFYSCCIDDINVTSNGSGPVVTDPTVATNAATAIGQTTATLNGTITNPDNVTITAKGFEWKATAGGTYQPVTVTGNNLTYNLTGLTASTGYTYKAFITFNGTTVYGNEVTFTTLENTPDPCNVPTGLTAGTITHESIAISWDADANVSSWNIQYRPVGGTLSSATATTNSYTITGLAPETEYQIQVQADCGDGNVSDWSAAINATTTTGIENHLLNSISLYPNPAKEYIDVRVDEFNVTSMEVYDVYGKLINTVNVIDNPTRINVSNLAAGMYFVRVTTEEGVATKSFVKK